MKKGENSRKDKFLRNFPQLTLGDTDSDIALRCKFNFHILTIIKSVLQILLCGMNKTFENCLRSLKHFLRSHYSIGNSNVSVLVLIDSICLKSMELFLENQGSVTLHMSRRMLTGQDSV